MPATVNFVRRIGATDIIIVADHDEAGRAGADMLARLLVTVADCVRIITPGKPGDDVRSFIAAGGTRGDLDDLIAEAPGMSIAIRRNVLNSQRNLERN